MDTERVHTRMTDESYEGEAGLVRRICFCTTNSAIDSTARVVIVLVTRWRKEAIKNYQVNKLRSYCESGRYTETVSSEEDPLFLALSAKINLVCFKNHDGSTKCSFEDFGKKSELKDQDVFLVRVVDVFDAQGVRAQWHLWCQFLVDSALRQDGYKQWSARFGTVKVIFVINNSLKKEGRVEGVPPCGLESNIQSRHFWAIRGVQLWVEKKANMVGQLTMYTNEGVLLL